MTLRESPLLRTFPPPQFFLAPGTGLALSSRAIRSATLSEQGVELALSDYGEEALPAGVFSAGEIKDRDALKTRLLNIAKEHRIRAAHIAIPEQPSFLLFLEIPLMARRDIRAYLAEQIEKEVPFSVRDILFDYEMAACAPKDGAPSLCASVAVIPKKIVDDYCALFRECGIAPRSLELGAHALARAVLPREHKGVALLVDIDLEETLVAVVAGKTVRFTATIAMGGGALTSALVKKMGVAPEEARRLKHRIGLKKSAPEADLVNTLLSPLSALRDEIKRHYLSWHTHLPEKGAAALSRIEKIVLSGEDAAMPGLADYLRSGLKEDLVIADPWQNIAPLGASTPELPRKDALRYAVAFGLALRPYD